MRIHKCFGTDNMAYGLKADISVESNTRPARPRPLTSDHWPVTEEHWDKEASKRPWSGRTVSPVISRTADLMSVWYFTSIYIYFISLWFQQDTKLCRVKRSTFDGGIGGRWRTVIYSTQWHRYYDINITFTTWHLKTWTIHASTAMTGSGKICSLFSGSQRTYTVLHEYTDQYTRLTLGHGRKEKKRVNRRSAKIINNIIDCEIQAHPPSRSININNMK